MNTEAECIPASRADAVCKVMSESTDNKLFCRNRIDVLFCEKDLAAFIAYPMGQSACFCAGCLNRFMEGKGTVFFFFGF